MPSHLVENQKITNENLSITFLCDVANGGTTDRQTDRQTNGNENITYFAEVMNAIYPSKLSFPVFALWVKL